MGVGVGLVWNGGREMWMCVICKLGINVMGGGGSQSFGVLLG